MATTSTTTAPALPDPFIARWSQFNVPCVWNRSINALPSDKTATMRLRAAMGSAPLAAYFEPGEGEGPKGIPIDRFEPGSRPDRLFATESQMENGTHSAWLPKPKVWETGTVDHHWSGTDGHKLYEAVALHPPAVAYEPASAPEVDPSNALYFLRKWYHYQTHRPVVWDLDDPKRNPAFTDGIASPLKPSAMASGLPMMPLLADAEHVDDPDVDPEFGLGHALIVSIPRNRIASDRPAWPATYTDGDATSNDSVLMGWRLRLSPSVDPTAFPPQAAAVIRTLQRYGAYVAMSATPSVPGDELFRMTLVAAPSKNAGSDKRWDLDDVRTLSMLTTAQFDVVAEDAFQSDPASFAA